MDIVDRLREMVRQPVTEVPVGDDLATRLNELLTEAADEIERLRGELHTATDY